MVEQDRCHDINAWEQRKLGDILSYEQPYEYIVSSDDYSPVARTPVLTAGKTLILGYTNEADGIKAVTKDSPVIIFDDFTASSHIIDYSFKIKSSAMKILSLRDSENDLYCIYYALTRIIRPSASHERQWISKYARATVTIPSKDEQQVIGDFLRKLDRLIAAEKRKLHLLQERKRSLLKGIFNRTIRFEGFTGVWKQQKLKDEAISISAGGDIDREKLLPSGRYPVIGNALSNNGIIGYYANDYEVKGPAVTVTGRGEVGVAKAREMNFTPVVRLLAIKSLHDSHFLECAINLHRAPLESTGVPQLTIPIISNYKLLFPPTLMEEMSIGLLFKHIDSLIAAVFLKIELLNLKKQSLLQQMFV